MNGIDSMVLSTQSFIGEWKMHQNTILIRILKSQAIAGSSTSAVDYALAQYGSNVSRLVEKAVLGSSSLLGDSDYRAAQRAFLELSRSKSLIGKIQTVSSFRKIPINVPTLKQTQAIQASWIKEADTIGLGGARFERVENDSKKLAAIIPVTKEVLKGVGADFESSLSADLVRGIATLEGESFIDPDNAGIPDTSPSSVLNGVSPQAATSDAKADLAELVHSFGGDMEYAVFIMRPETAVILAGLGFDGAGARGGEIAGVPLVTSNAVPEGVVALIDPQGILLSDEGVEFSISEQASLQAGVDSNGAPIYVNLYQENVAAIRALRYINWKIIRDGSAAYIEGANWGGQG